MFLRLRPLLCLVCLCACAEAPLDANDDANEGDDDDELPEVDCATVPTVLDEPVASWAEAQPNPELHFLYDAAVMPGGDLVWIAENQRVVRWTPDGQEVWSYDAGDYLFGLGASATGEIVLRGRTQEQLEWSSPLLLRLDAEGNFMQRELIDEHGGASNLVVTPGGDTIAQLVPDTEALEFSLASFDRDLQLRWNVGIEVAHAIATDSDGNAYVVHMRSTQGDPLEWLWGITVVARTADGELAWTSDEIEVPSMGGPAPRIAVGDLVYVAVASEVDSDMLAFGRDGEFAWDYDFHFDDSNYHVSAIAASPCGGVYLGGRNDTNWLAWLSTMDSQGVLGPIVELSTPLPDEYFFHETTQLLVSAFGDVVAIGELRRPGSTPDRAWIKAY